MEILLVHGVGHAERDPQWDLAWQRAITAGLQEHNPGLAPTYSRLDYDEIFDKWPDPLTYSWATARLLGAPIGSWIFGRRGLFDWVGASAEITDRWHAGMVARWVVEDNTRKELQARFAALIREKNPDVIFAHSLGSLVTYDFFDEFVAGDSPANNRILVTFGSQIGNLFVRSERFGGRIRSIGAKYWFHLYNPRDPVFTAQIKEPIANFEQLITESLAGHDAISVDPAKPGYLQHPVTRDNVYALIASEPGARKLEKRQTTIRSFLSRPKRRALLVGINEYPDPASRLHGCVNDVFEMSALLQEVGFDAEDIRVVFNDRATRQGILERLEWLLDGSTDGQERVFYYSGHGAQLPGYNPKETVDYVDECLVNHDFAWSKDSAITDDDFCQFYSALPYGTKFYAIFDCCHSGGLARDGSHTIRAIAPPDDIRHRILKWNSEAEAWVPRELPEFNREFGPKSARERFMGENMATLRVGRAMPLRAEDKRTYETRKKRDNFGPYMPIILEACDENSYAYEYRHGVTSYGAFTFLFTRLLRERWRSGRPITFAEAQRVVNEQLKSQLGFDQRVNIEGPGDFEKSQIFGDKRKES